jgi:phosphosulfolactate synthase
MNFDLPYVPAREKKERNTGITMVMDKGLGLKQTENFIESSAELVDIVKFGFGSSAYTNNLTEKIKLYKQAKIRPYFGGTLFEAFVVRNMFDDFLKVLDTYELNLAEVSDGSMRIEHETKLEYIQKLSEKVTVLSEVGSKQRGVFISTEQWISMMASELNAGAWKVIGEARESGTIGIYNSDGTANEGLVNSIINEVKTENILWEAPSGKQQVWFIKLLGANVNLGNIAPELVIPLECLRGGLRGDTFFDFLPTELKQDKNPLRDTISAHIDFQI